MCFVNLSCKLTCREIEEIDLSVVVCSYCHVKVRMRYNAIWLGVYWWLRNWKLIVIYHLWIGRVKKSNHWRLICQHKMGLTCLYPRSSCWNLIRWVGHSAQYFPMIVLSFSVDISCAPNCSFWISTHRQEHALIVMVSEIPIGFTVAILLSPLPNAIVSAIKSITILVNFLYSWQVPHTDNSLTASCEKNFFQLSILILSWRGNWEKRACMSSQSNVRLNVSIIFLIKMVDSF
jgi:hypothetical protein